MRLSLLDRSRISAGQPDEDGLTGSVERALWAETLGYHRFWVAEHHSVPGVASGSPAVILAAIGAHTKTIRIGSGGVMLPNHRPYVVAEQFRMLQALYPGRVDLGIGRSLGFTEPVRRALRTPDSDAYESDLVELGTYLTGTAPVTVRPAIERQLPVFLLATGKSMQMAARQGLPIVVGGPILHEDSISEVLADYRQNFRPSVFAAEPYVMVSLDVIVAEDEATARHLALSEAWALARSRQTGEFGPLEDPQHIQARSWTNQIRARVERNLRHAILGDANSVQTQLDRLSARTGADELLASTSTYDRSALYECDASLRQILN